MRNSAFEARVESLIAAQSLTWIRTPAGMGKRAAVAAWLRHSVVNQETIWLTLSPDAMQQREALGVIFDAIAVANWDHASMQAIPAPGALAQRRTHARGVVQKRGRRTMLVIELGVQRLAPSELSALVAFVAESAALRILFIEDDDFRSMSHFGENLADLNAHDLRVKVGALRGEFARLDLPIADAVAARIVDRHHGDFALSAALVSEVVRNPQRDVEISLATAHAHVLVEAAQQLMPEGAPTVLALLALIPEIHESHLATAVSGGRVDLELRSLQERGLLESWITPEGEYVYGLSDSVREIVRSITLPHYLHNRRHLHLLARDYFVAIGDVGSAAQQLQHLGEPNSAIDLFAAHWLSYRRLNSHDKSRELCSMFSLTDMLLHLEGSAAVWLICSNSLSASIAAPYAARILGAKDSELGTLTPRARLTVHIARMLIFLDRERPELAAKVAAETTADRERVLRQEANDIGELHLEYLLAVARTALSNGAFRRAAIHYDEALALSETIRDPASTYRALSGLALTLTVNGELAATQELINRARALEQELDLSHSYTAAEIAWCECLIRAFKGEERTIPAVTVPASNHPRFDDIWARVSTFAAAQTMFRAGRNPAAAGVLRNLLSSLAGRHKIPLFRQTIASVLSRILTASNQPGAALTVLKGESSNEAHFPCIESARALAHIARGDPLAAIEATNACIELGHEHATASLISVYIARTLAFESTDLPTSAEDAFITAASIAANAGMRVNLETLAGQQLVDVRARSQMVMPEADALAVNIKCSDVQQSRGHPQQLTKPTIREREILGELTSPLTLVEIAAKLFISKNTLKTHTRSLYRKLGVTSRQEAMDIAHTWGMGTPNSSTIG
ncbi:ATP/maltotriose-dependent transcriptional regulator MalT [Rhodoglobus vestalii]|uniref:ATP/maltotriose-dependent transcriptional regulator MalT n=1 Tax=Rhodoglobus vestalii TaxID=193384 RepID=A0A8H2K8Z7_9MICO|nr:helix-turn-helix transcriptional regulator [Rhodoglobus vestalii]TQO21087.1 ATP/maltotriose-dependent transcriptional regulator MalT [Rhodoglobus vestalii]